MSNKEDKIEELLIMLKDIEIKITNQEKDVKTYIDKASSRVEITEILIAHMRSLKTSIELLRDEIDELEQIILTQKT
ncbi:MAG: hypothetical protein H6910_06020 [Rickettsiaceae bacterium]|nr:hypothetical protein [Rickettsiaceae bacterium]MCP5378654.1 hypothetical protein [Rickettsiaceae bacterium]